MACEKASERCLSFSRHLSLSPESRASSTRLDVPFSPDGYVPFSPVASSRPHNRMGFSDLNGEVGGHFHWTKHRRRCRTTSETDFGNVVTLPRSYPTRPISPTRNNNPQPVGLVFQSPYNKTGKTFQIWNPELYVIEKKIPELLSHVREVNFSCGTTKSYNPHRGSLQEVRYSFQSTNRSSFKNPDNINPRLKDTLPTTRFGSSPDAAAVGIVPQVLAPLRSKASNKQNRRGHDMRK